VTEADTSFDALETAGYGERLGGVALAPVPEPGNLALMPAALRLIGVCAKRRPA